MSTVSSRKTMPFLWSKKGSNSFRSASSLLSNALFSFLKFIVKFLSLGFKLKSYWNSYSGSNSSAYWENFLYSGLNWPVLWRANLESK